MRVLGLAAISGSLLALTGLCAAQSLAPSVEGCSPIRPDSFWLGMVEAGDGPLRLTRLICGAETNPSLVERRAFISPDGSRIVYVGREGVHTAPVAPGGASVLHRLHPVVVPFDDRDGQVMFQWGAGSDRIWAATQDILPDGAPVAGMRPALGDLAGGVTPLPDLNHEAGPLDALYWIGGRGLALAEFGTRGGHYRPEHDDPAPTLAFVDAAQGRILDTLPLSEIGAPRVPGLSASSRIGHVSAIVLPDGRPRAVVRVDSRWVVWTQEDAMRLLPHPYRAETRFALSPDGARLIAAPPHPSIGSMTHVRILRPSERTEPHNGLAAVMHDVETGRVLWTLDVFASGSYPVADPVFSPDGRYILIVLPPADGYMTVALLEAANGRELQRVRTISGRPFSMGFAADGDTAWTSMRGMTVFYRVE